ncbi:hypothetical protein Hsar01_04111 [Haloferula sargassicola]|uniref:DUF4062 domain-containing protein n=2 Tax=Haloferula sargassicola TaxID=490096 RepID=A0ABP9UTK6_9BACT
MNSHYGTIQNRPGQSNEEACLEAVEDCHLVLAIIRSRYGSGITLKEICRAIEIEKPVWKIAEQDIEKFRQLLKPILYATDATTNLPVARVLVPNRKTGVLDDLRIIDLYNLCIQDHLPVSERRSNWVQSYEDVDDVFRFLETNLKDVDRVRQIIQPTHP